MSTDYAGHARKIIKDSIVSSLYIDDEIVEPFSAPEEGKENFLNISKGIYESFRKENKSVDFYKFKNGHDWRADKDYLFKNRDLLILDWQLNGRNETRQEETMQILKQAVTCDNLHFISVYTATEPSKFSDIFYSIKAFFAIEYSEGSVKKYQELINALDDGGANTDKFIALNTAFKSYSLAALPQKNEIYEKLKKEIQDLLGKENYILFSKSLRSINKDIPTACEIIGFCMNKEIHSQSDSLDITVNTDFIGENFIVINHTIVQLSHKNAPEPQNLFASFTDAVLSVCGNLLTLVSLEIRSFLRESSGFIGKDADSIADATLFHQKKNKEAFFDILMGIIQNHTSSYFEYKNNKIISLTEAFWEAYDNKKAIKEKVTALERDKALLHGELSKINVYYNELHIKKGEEDIVRFGDVFYSRNAVGKLDGKFFLCTTAHCDCLKPEENIKNNFYFIMGQHSSIEKAIGQGDNSHNSFIKINGEIIAIEWFPRPIVLNIPKNKIKDLTATDGLGAKYSLIYAATLKENYAQRMANNSFSFPMRVGIDFAAL